ncbi:MAG: ABC transporter ATP-binding protein [Lachnospiraceae bacterium]|nr:ABC transporter ATP-binding protein [Lachnospiraceae bacterium]
MNNVLEVKNLTKKYDNFYLDNVSFSIEKGKIVGFIGTNGSGKSTTLKAILGLIHSQSDKIEYFGKTFSKNSRDIKNKLGVVLDDGYYYEILTIEQMKSVIAPAYDNWEDSVFNELLSRFSLNKRQKISTLSKGMKMKFSIAIALAHHAELIIMDEPTSGLDPLVRSDLMELLKEIVEKEGCSILFSTHIISDLEKIADKIIFIEQGKIVFEKEKQKLLEEYEKILKSEQVNIENIMLYHVKGGLE